MTDTGVPRFFHIGTQRAGSTYLYHLLSSHPDTSLARDQEPDFYFSNYELGVDWYLGQFGPGTVRVDTSPKYFMRGDLAVPRIHDAVGDLARFSLILRNPIDYLRSHFELHRRTGYFEQRPDLYPRSYEYLVDFVREYPEYLDRARYAQILDRYWFTRYGPEHFHIVTFEEFVADPASNAQAICESFGLSPAPLTAPETARNATIPKPFFNLKRAISRYPSLRKLVKKLPVTAPAYRAVQRAGGAVAERTGHELTESQRGQIADLLGDDVAELAASRRVDVGLWADFA